MARQKFKTRSKAKSAIAILLDATLERQGQAGNDNSEMILVKPGRPGEAMYRVRRFKDAAIDRMLRAKRISFAQWFAADWYRGIYEQAGITHRMTANLNPAGGGECAYGMPTTERQARCREKLRSARAIIGDKMVGLVDNLVLHDLAPALHNGRQRERYGDTMARALQPLADWLAAPLHE